MREHEIELKREHKSKHERELERELERGGAMPCRILNYKIFYILFI